jgi:cell surface protein SprA
VNGRPNTNVKSNFFQDIEINYLPKTLTFNSDISRNYNELQLRDLSNFGSSGENLLPASFRDDFFWNRSLNVQWDLTKNLNLSFNSNTNARIETPYVQVNKQLFPDQYAQWKDSVWRNIRQLGTPLDYKQTFSANYNVPFRSIPALNFLTASLQFNSNYSWQRGASLADSTIELGNTISNNRTIEINNATFNLLSLYNKSKFLEDANKKYSMKRSGAPTTTVRLSPAQLAAANRNQTAAAENKKKKFEGTFTLNPDSGIIVRHQLNNKRLRITARNEAGKLYDLKYKALDLNSIQIKNKDSVNLKLTISQLPPLEDDFWYKLAQGLARGLMMVRSVGFSYSQSTDMLIPSFRPNIGNFTGQGSSPIGNAPGLDFAFGLAGTDYIDKANRRGWLIQNTDGGVAVNTTPAIINQTESFKFTAQIEPIVGMRIMLNADRTSSKQNQIYFMYDNMLPQMNGNFVMSTISIGSAFEPANPSNGYYSKTFETFLNNRTVIAGRLGDIYNRATYPNTGFLANDELAGKPYDPAISPVNPNSADVLIPAFIAAYTGRSPNSVGLSAFPSLLKLLPNWDITYDGLMQLSFINKLFRTFQLKHRYSSIYAVGAYNSFMNWITANGTDGIGFTQNVTSNYPTPSSPFDITTVSITEAFNPLIELNSTFLNNVSLSIKYSRTRNVNLNITSYQITELLSNDFSLGTGYRFDNFNRVLKIRKTGGASFNNELKLDAIITYSKKQSLIRQIENSFTQAILGDVQTMFKLSADYSLSKMITLQGYFDRQISNPLISSTAYPLTKTDFGLNVRVNFSR